MSVETAGDPAAVAAVRAALDERGASVPIRRFETAVPSAAAAAEQIGCDLGAIANSLVFRAGDGVVLVLASGARRVDAARVARHLGIGRNKVKRAHPGLVLEVTGQKVGGIAPVGHRTRLTTLVDRALAEHDVVWAGAGDEHSMFPTSAAQLLDLTGGELVDVAAPS